MELEKRIEKWDYLKFVLIVLVVLGHIADFYVDKSSMMRMVFIFIYIFHMPLFIFVSGMFAKRNIKEKRYKRIFSFLILYFLIKIIMCIGNMFILDTFTFSVFYESGAPWYAMAIFLQSLITIALSRFSKKYILIASMVLACVLGLDSSITDFMALSRTIVYYPFFFAGYCLEQERISNMLNKKVLKIGAAIILVALAVVVILNIENIYWIRPILTGRNPYSSLGDRMQYGPFIRFIYYIAVTIIGMSIISLIPNRINNKLGRWMAGMGRRTLQIYALHYVIIKIFVYVIPVYDVMKKILPSYTMIYAFPLAIIITVFCGLRILTNIFNILVFPKIKE